MLCAACALPWFDAGTGKTKDNLPRIPRAALLVGYPPASLSVTTSRETWTADGQGEWLNILPSMSHDGTMVGSARFVEMAEVVGSDGIRLPRPQIAIATCFLMNRKWTDYKELTGFQGAIAIAPDGSKLAFTMTADPRKDPQIQVHVIDLETRSENIMTVGRGYAGGHVSWSPDGRRIAYDMRPKNVSGDQSKYTPGIEVLDLATEKSIKIADGEAPAWSPSGEWIAYLDNSRNWETRTGGSEKDRWYEPPKPDRVSIVRPDGTESRVVVTLGKDRILGVLFSADRIFRYAPVWSPDSATLLLNEFADFLGIAL